MRRAIPGLLLLAMILSGCAWLAPDYERPAADMPEKWPSEQADAAVPNNALKEWWKEFHDPALTALIDEALANNDDLALAGARLRQAKAQYDYATANRLPLLSAVGYASRSQLDAKDSLLTDKPGSSAFLGGMLSYEVDLWGKLASAQQAAKAALLAESHSRDAARLSIAAATAQLYFSILALDADIAITRDTIRSREESVRLVQRQFAREAVNGLVLRQSEAELAATRAQLPKLKDQRDRAESSLAVLLGRSPRAIVEGKIERGPAIDALPVPPVVPAELPSALLERRPDIAAAEQALIASNFNIGTARAAYFPTISLAGLLGVSTIDIENIYSGTMRAWEIGATMAGPVVDFGRTASGVDLAQARNQELLIAYKSSIRSAFKEVRDALSSQTNSRDEEQAQADEEQAVGKALHLATLRYDAGYSSYIEVLDAQRTLYGAQLSLVAAKLDRLNVAVALYKALGGGWEPEDAAR